MPKTIKFKKERETKNCTRYQEEAELPAIGTLYVKKWWLVQEFSEMPEHITVSVEA